MDVDVLSDRIRRFFEGRPEAALAVYLFGSQARGEARPDSDVDVAVFRGRTETGLAALALDVETDLERQLGRPVQVIVLDSAPADLVHRVLRDGILLVDRDPLRRVDFEVQRRNEYFDLLPVLREYRRGATEQRR